MTANAPNRRSRQEELGQFLTAGPTADFMASMFGPLPNVVRLIDAGAGAGALTAAFVEMVFRKGEGVREIHSTLYEIDPNTLETLEVTMHQCQTRCSTSGIGFTFTIHCADFITEMSA
jgi:adenine-specific DNA-methyltransferase